MSTSEKIGVLVRKTKGESRAYCSDSISIQSKGLGVLKCFSWPSSTSSLSATKLMYCTQKHQCKHYISQTMMHMTLTHTHPASQDMTH